MREPMARIVVALGGNALGNTPAEQREKVAEAAGTLGAAAGEERRIRFYSSLRALEAYLRSIDALDRPLEELGRPI